MQILKYLIVVLSFSIVSCTELTAPLPSTDFSALLQSWTHSYEEQTDSIQVYRPSNYKNFEQSRFRGTYEFRADGVCTYLVLGPADGHYLETGKWSTSVQDDSVIVIFDSSGVEHQKIQIIELRGDLLRFVYVQ